MRSNVYRSSRTSGGEEEGLPDAGVTPRPHRSARRGLGDISSGESRCCLASWPELREGDDSQGVEVRMSGRFGYPLAASLVIVAVLVPARARAQCCVASSGCFCDLRGTIKDACTGLQWEKKTTAVGSGVNPADLHDVDNRYSWAGACTVGGAYCQPNAAAAATCAARADGGTFGCSTCASGTCNVDWYGAGAITTVWDWINQVNAANYAGHNDWRLPSEGGHNSPGTGANELGPITAYPRCEPPACINSIFGPTESSYHGYWSASTYMTSPPSDPASWWVDFGNGIAVPFGTKIDARSVRAVR